MNILTKRKTATVLMGLAVMGMAIAPAAPAMASHDAISANVADEPPNWTPSNIGAMAATCDWSPGDNGSGGATVKNSIWLRTGPGAGCANASGYSIPVGARLGGWCYGYSSAGNLWYYVSVGGTSPHGWIYSGNVKNVTVFDTPCS